MGRRATLALCNYLIRAALASNYPVGFIGASRPSPSTDSLAAALEQAMPPEAVSRMSLQPLSRDEGIRLAIALAPGLPRQRPEATWASARGSPFWIGALVRGGGANFDADEIVGALLRDLNADATELLAILTVAGRPLSVPELGLLLAWDPARIDSTSARLINRGLVLAKGMSLALAHDLIREAALRQLPIQERRRIHRQLAAWLEAQAGDDVGLLGLALEHRRGGALPPVTWRSG